MSKRDSILSTHSSEKETNQKWLVDEIAYDFKKLDDWEILLKIENNTIFSL
ncbi:MAG: hypothetical protein GY760_25580 [Deltaproteobacteria bacterium]|nr:hypothetical protein [Deltaproteobacteria bacterium]